MPWIRLTARRPRNLSCTGKDMPIATIAESTTTAGQPRVAAPEQPKQVPLIDRVFEVIFKFTRPRRMRRLARLLHPTDATKVLDVGGSTLNWSYLKSAPRVTLLNIRPAESLDDSGQFEFVLGDGCALEYADKSFDLAYSNSVIEHLGSWDKQVRFAAELRRAGKQIWMQTPAKECPIEPHYLTPFVHWLPREWQRKILRNCSFWGIVERPSQAQVDEMVDEVRLLSKREVRELFPDCQILIEWFLCFPKSYIAVRK